MLKFLFIKQMQENEKAFQNTEQSYAFCFMLFYITPHLPKSLKIIYIHKESIPFVQPQVSRK